MNIFETIRINSNHEHVKTCVALKCLQEDGDLAFSPDWGVWQNKPVCTVCELAALSVGINPIAIDVTALVLQQLEKAHPVRQRFVEYLRRVDITDSNLVPKGELQVFKKSAYPEYTTVKSLDFVKFAHRMRWSLSPEFPGIKELGTVLILPWKSEQLEKVASLIENDPMFTGACPERLTVKEVTNKINEVLNSQRKSNGLASLILSKEISAEDD